MTFFFEEYTTKCYDATATIEEFLFQLGTQFTNVKWTGLEISAEHFDR